METVAIIIALALVAGGVVLYIHRAESNGAALEQREATLQAERERRHATEKAAAAAAVARKATFDEAAHEITTAADAARLLRETANRTGN